MSVTFRCEHAWLGQVADDVTITVEDGLISAVTLGEPDRTPDAELAGLTIPGLANTHSHAFHRALRGVEASSGTFWTWQQDMYRLAERLDPDSYYALARAVYGEMAMAGVTAVGEFHYLHHQRDGGRYDDPNAMSAALVAAAAEAGVRLTLLDTLYVRGGFDQPIEGVQARFSDGSVDAWAERVDSLVAADAMVGAAVHSVRAVDAESAAAVAEWAGANRAPLHFHLSEQVAENEACVAATGMTPTELLSESGLLGPASTAVHATHLAPTDIVRLGDSSTTVCFCPTTERELGDGIGPAAALRGAGSRLAVGSDSHAVIDIVEEARLLELHERLATQQRGHFPLSTLYDAASRNGMKALGWDAGAIETGLLADFVTIRLDSVRTAGIADPGAVVLAASAADISDVVVGGRQIVRHGVHQSLTDVAGMLAGAVRPLMA